MQKEEVLALPNSSFFLPTSICLVQSREFSEMLKKTLNAYHNRAIATQGVIDELIKLAKQMSAANQRGVDLGLNDDEIALTPSLPLSRVSPAHLLGHLAPSPSGSILRRTRRQQIRRRSDGQRRTQSHRRRVSDAGSQECHDRLDVARKRPCQDQGHGETH